MPMRETIQLESGVFTVAKLLGKGKSGHSWLIENGSRRLVLKRMHDEPCAYYRFGDKLAAELAAYERLKDLVGMPRLIESSTAGRYLVKEYIQGATLSEMCAARKMPPDAYVQMLKWCRALYARGINLDYFPANFIYNSGKLYYIDYELNPYAEEWDFEHWGVYYWLNSVGMREFLATGDHLAINLPGDKGKPIAEPFKKLAEETIKKYGGK